MSNQRIVIGHCMVVLAHVVDAKGGQHCQNQERYNQPTDPKTANQAYDGQDDKGGKNAIALGHK